MFSERYGNNFIYSIFPKNVIQKSISPKNIFPKSIFPKNVFQKSVFQENIFARSIFPKEYFSKECISTKLTPGSHIFQALRVCWLAGQCQKKDLTFSFKRNRNFEIYQTKQNFWNLSNKTEMLKFIKRNINFEIYQTEQKFSSASVSSTTKGLFRNIQRLF